MQPDGEAEQGWTPLQLWLLALLAMMAVAYGFLVKGIFAFADESIYYHIAYNLRHLHAFSVDTVHPTAIRPPGYPWLLAGIQSVSESVKFAKLFNLVLWPVCGLLTGSLAGKLFGRMAATFALLISIAYVVELYIAGTLYPQTPCSFLFLLSLWMHFVWRRSGELIESVLQGLVWAAIVAAIPVFIINLLVYVGRLVFIKKRLTQVLVILIMVALPCVVWTARNVRMMHAPFISDNTGEMLLYGNSDLTGPNTGPQIPIWLIAPDGPRQHNELAEENIYKTTAIQWIRRHPQRAAVLYVEKVFNWFNCQLNLKTRSEQSNKYQLLIAMVYYPVLLASLLSPWLLRSSRELESYFALHYFIAAASYAIFFTRMRYRLPYDYLIIILAAGVCATLTDSYKARRQSVALSTDAVSIGELANRE